MQTPTLTVVTARRLRRALTPPEAKLWAALRGRQLAGLKFRRQHPMGPYVLDFYSPQVRLAVEVDGLAHDRAEQITRDAERDQWLAAQGVEMLRVQARDVRDHVDGVLALIAATARPVLILRAGDRGPPPPLRGPPPPDCCRNQGEEKCAQPRGFL